VPEQQYAARVLMEALAVRLTVPLYTAEDLASLKEALGSMTELKGHDLDSWEAAHPSRPSPTCMMDSLKGSS
jgi:DNA-binding GntR family transcriptional regulator